jgi:ribosomal protein S27AE
MAGVTSSHTSAAMRGRRATLRWLTAWLLGGTVSWLSVGRGSQKSDLVCAKPSALSQDENRQRRRDNYTEKSLEPSKTCSGCGFFTAAADPLACGKCQIFNGPANPQGKCDDWTRRPV